MSQPPVNERIQSVLEENRRFPPPPAFAEDAHLSDPGAVGALRARAADDHEAYWVEAARDEVRWGRPFTEGLDASDAPFYRWFADGTLNVADNCLDRHCETWRRNKAALIWEGEPVGDRGPEVRTFTYAQLLREVCRLANGLASLGVGEGDRVALYMPMIPEAVFAMLACARLGAIHSIVFAGFSAESLRDRIVDAEAKLVITADGGHRKGKVLDLKAVVDAAIDGDGEPGSGAGTPSVEHVVVVRHTEQHIEHFERDRAYHVLVDGQPEARPPAMVGAEHPLFILYTSGTTGKPKGVVHSTGGYLVHATRSTRWVFDLKDEDVYWCTADIGWITGHTYVVYGVLSNGGTSLIYEGAPDSPRKDRFWDIIERHQVSVFYTAPTALRTFIRWGDEHVTRHNLSSLRVLGTVGEPINPAAWVWYHEVVGGGRCPIVDTWWQTETGGVMITPLPGVQTCVPGSATRPLPGVAAEIVDGDGKTLDGEAGGLLVIRKPWPSMLRTVWGDPERFKQTYFGRFPGTYFAGDGARRDADGNFWILGRVDDVVNVSGHRLGTMEVESALVSHDDVAEAAVVARPDEITGQAIVAFVTPQGGVDPGPALGEALRQHVASEIGAIARPAEIRFAAALPKTRSGKIMRRLLRELASTGQVTGDVTTLEDMQVIEKLRAVDD